MLVSSSITMKPPEPSMVPVAKPPSARGFVRHQAGFAVGGLENEFGGQDRHGRATGDDRLQLLPLRMPPQYCSE